MSAHSKPLFYPSPFDRPAAPSVSKDEDIQRPIHPANIPPAGRQRVISRARRTRAPSVELGGLVGEIPPTTSNKRRGPSPTAERREKSRILAYPSRQDESKPLNGAAPTRPQKQQTEPASQHRPHKRVRKQGQKITSDAFEDFLSVPVPASKRAKAFLQKDVPLQVARPHDTLPVVESASLVDKIRELAKKHRHLTTAVSVQEEAPKPPKSKPYDPVEVQAFMKRQRQERMKNKLRPAHDLGEYHKHVEKPKPYNPARVQEFMKKQAERQREEKRKAEEERNAEKAKRIRRLEELDEFRRKNMEVRKKYELERANDILMHRSEPAREESATSESYQMRQLASQTRDTDILAEKSQTHRPRMPSPPLRRREPDLSSLDVENRWNKRAMRPKPPPDHSRPTSSKGSIAVRSDRSGRLLTHRSANDKAKAWLESHNGGAVSDATKTRKAARPEHSESLATQRDVDVDLEKDDTFRRLKALVDMADMLRKRTAEQLEALDNEQEDVESTPAEPFRSSTHTAPIVAANHRHRRTGNVDVPDDTELHLSDLRTTTQDEAERLFLSSKTSTDLRELPPLLGGRSGQSKSRSHDSRKLYSSYPRWVQDDDWSVLKVWERKVEDTRPVRSGSTISVTSDPDSERATLATVDSSRHGYVAQEEVADQAAVPAVEETSGVLHEVGLDGGRVFVLRGADAQSASAAQPEARTVNVRDAARPIGTKPAPDPAADEHGTEPGEPALTHPPQPTQPALYSSVSAPPESMWAGPTVPPLPESGTVYGVFASAPSPFAVMPGGFPAALNDLPQPSPITVDSAFTESNNEPVPDECDHCASPEGSCCCSCSCAITSPADSECPTCNPPTDIPLALSPKTIRRKLSAEMNLLEAIELSRLQLETLGSVGSKVELEIVRRDAERARALEEEEKRQASFEKSRAEEAARSNQQVPVPAEIVEDRQELLPTRLNTTEQERAANRKDVGVETDPEKIDVGAQTEKVKGRKHASRLSSARKINVAEPSSTKARQETTYNDSFYADDVSSFGEWKKPQPIAVDDISSFRKTASESDASEIDELLPTNASGSAIGIVDDAVDFPTDNVTDFAEGAPSVAEDVDVAERPSRGQSMDNMYSETFTSPSPSHESSPDISSMGSLYARLNAARHKSQADAEALRKKEEKLKFGREIAERLLQKKKETEEIRKRVEKEKRKINSVLGSVLKQKDTKGKNRAQHVEQKVKGRARGKSYEDIEEIIGDVDKESPSESIQEDYYDDVANSVRESIQESIADEISSFHAGSRALDDDISSFHANAEEDERGTPAMSVTPEDDDIADEASSIKSPSLIEDAYSSSFATPHSFSESNVSLGITDSTTALARRISNLRKQVEERREKMKVLYREKAERRKKKMEETEFKLKKELEKLNAGVKKLSSEDTKERTLHTTVNTRVMDEDDLSSFHVPETQKLGASGRRTDRALEPAERVPAASSAPVEKADLVGLETEPYSEDIPEDVVEVVSLADSTEDLPNLAAPTSRTEPGVSQIPSEVAKATTYDEDSFDISSFGGGGDSPDAQNEETRTIPVESGDAEAVHDKDAGEEADVDADVYEDESFELSSSHADRQAPYVRSEEGATAALNAQKSAYSDEAVSDEIEEDIPEEVISAVSDDQTTESQQIWTPEAGALNDAGAPLKELNMSTDAFEAPMSGVLEDSKEDVVSIVDIETRELPATEVLPSTNRAVDDYEEDFEEVPAAEGVMHRPSLDGSTIAFEREDRQVDLEPEGISASKVAGVHAAQDDLIDASVHVASSNLGDIGAEESDHEAANISETAPSVQESSPESLTMSAAQVAEVSPEVEHKLTSHAHEVGVEEVSESIAEEIEEALSDLSDEDEASPDALDAVDTTNRPSEHSELVLEQKADAADAVETMRRPSREHTELVLEQEPDAADAADAVETMRRPSREHTELLLEQEPDAADAVETMRRPSMEHAELVLEQQPDAPEKQDLALEGLDSSQHLDFDEDVPDEGIHSSGEVPSRGLMNALPTADEQSYRVDIPGEVRLPDYEADDFENAPEEAPPQQKPSSPEEVEQSISEDIPEEIAESSDDDSMEHDQELAAPLTQTVEQIGVPDASQKVPVHEQSAVRVASPTVVKTTEQSQPVEPAISHTASSLHDLAAPATVPSDPAFRTTSEAIDKLVLKMLGDSVEAMIQITARRRVMAEVKRGVERVASMDLLKSVDSLQQQHIGERTMYDSQHMLGNGVKSQSVDEFQDAETTSFSVDRDRFSISDTPPAQVHMEPVAWADEHAQDAASPALAVENAKAEHTVGRDVHAETDAEEAFNAYVALIDTNTADVASPNLLPVDTDAAGMPSPQLVDTYGADVISPNLPPLDADMAHTGSPRLLPTDTDASNVISPQLLPMKSELADIGSPELLPTDTDASNVISPQLLPVNSELADISSPNIVPVETNVSNETSPRLLANQGAEYDEERFEPDDGALATLPSASLELPEEVATMVALQAELAKLANVHAVVPSTAAVADSIADMILADLFKEMMSNVKRIGETLHSGASEARKASKAEGEVNVQAEEVEETPMPALPPVSTTAPSNAVVNVDDSPSEVAVTVPPSDMPLPQAPQALPLEEDIEVVTESEVVTAFVRDELLTYLPPPPSTGLYTRPPLLPGSILRHVQKKYGTHHKDSNLQPARERATFPLNRDTILLLHSLTNEALQRIFNPDMTSLMATTLTLLSSRGMTRQQVVAQCTRLVGQWSAYVDENGENLDQLLVREVKSSERAWRAGGSEEIGEKVAEGLWEECLESAVKELKRLGEKRNV